MLTIATFTIISAFGANSPITKEIILTSLIDPIEYQVEIQYNNAEITKALKGFDIATSETTEKFDILFSGRKQNTQIFTIQIVPGEFETTVDNTPNTLSGVIPTITSARNDMSEISPSYTTFSIDTFTTKLYPGKHTNISGADFKLSWTGNPYVPAGTWTSTNIIRIAATL